MTRLLLPLLLLAAIALPATPSQQIARSHQQGTATQQPSQPATGYDLTLLYIPPGSYVPPLPWVPPMLSAHLQPSPPQPVAQPVPPSSTER